MPSSISVGATRSPRPTTNFAICLILIKYCSCSSAPFWPCTAPNGFTERARSAFAGSTGMIFVQRATCSGCSSPMRCLSAGRSHKFGDPRPVSDSFTPIRLYHMSTALCCASKLHTKLLIDTLLDGLDIFFNLLEAMSIRSLTLLRRLRIAGGDILNYNARKSSRFGYHSHQELSRMSVIHQIHILAGIPLISFSSLSSAFFSPTTPC